LGWELLGTDVLNAQVQAQAQAALADTFEQARAQPPEVEQVQVTTPEAPDTESPSPTNPTPEVVEWVKEPEPEPGEAFGVMRIPKIGLEAVIFSGVDLPTLKKGPGHMPWTPLPGQPGNSVISGHRTTYGRPFFDVDLLEPGDVIEVETAIGIHVYEVRETLIVKPTDIWVTNPRPGAWLTLTACNPKFSARERIIIVAELVSGPNFEYAELQKAQLGAS
jgi:sortase A